MTCGCWIMYNLSLYVAKIQDPWWYSMDYRVYMGSSMKVQLSRRLPLYLCSYKFNGSVTHALLRITLIYIFDHISILLSIWNVFSSIVFFCETSYCFRNTFSSPDVAGHVILALNLHCTHIALYPYRSCVNICGWLLCSDSGNSSKS